LEPDEETQAEEAAGHGSVDLLAHGEVGEGSDESEADETPEDAVRPFPEENRLKVFDGDGVVEPGEVEL
jgi:hypothetical protein